MLALLDLLEEYVLVWPPFPVAFSKQNWDKDNKYAWQLTLIPSCSAYTVLTHHSVGLCLFACAFTASNCL